MKFGVRDQHMTLHTCEFHGSCVGKAVLLLCVSMQLHLHMYIENIWLLRAKLL